MSLLVILENHIEAGGEKGIYRESAFEELYIQFFFEGCRRLPLQSAVESFCFFINLHLTFFNIIS